MNVEACEREVDRTELYLADEVFFCGSAWEITPITSVDRYPVGEGAIGPVTRKAQQIYQDVVRGRVPKYKQWLTPVY
jgi:branched-chain amino acid aminotransferase